mmetsp:Transcript_30904/g.78252  ORF Transcript_30904/g.78252 Transcript_30904/m.78252 type:complete len:258 (-) Transcript_30904:101-874(-)
MCRQTTCQHVGEGVERKQLGCREHGLAAGESDLSEDLPPSHDGEERQGDRASPQAVEPPRQRHGGSGGRLRHTVDGKVLLKGDLAKHFTRADRDRSLTHQEHQHATSLTIGPDAEVCGRDRFLEVRVPILVVDAVSAVHVSLPWAGCAAASAGRELLAEVDDTPLLQLLFDHVFECLGKLLLVSRQLGRRAVEEKLQVDFAAVHHVLAMQWVMLGPEAHIGQSEGPVEGVNAELGLGLVGNGAAKCRPPLREDALLA